MTLSAKSNEIRRSVTEPRDSGMDLVCPSLRDFVYLIVGNLLRSKGHDLVLRALGNLKASVPRFRCRIIGEGPGRATV
jgi:glycosyltransferase involved in cell wall biosynthesis